MKKNIATFQISKIAQNISLLIEIKAATETPTKYQIFKISHLYQSTIDLMYRTAAEFLELKGDKTSAAALRSKKGINQQEANEATNAALKGLKDFLKLNIPDKFLIMENTVIGQPLTRKKNKLQN